MESKFFNGFLVLLFPDGIFKRIIREKDTFRPFISILISSVFLSTLSIFLFKVCRLPQVSIRPNEAVLIVAGVYFLVIVLTAALSIFFNWLYSIAIRLKTQRLSSDFAGNFLCHIHVVPLWLFLVFLTVLTTDKDINGFLLSIAVCFTIRLLDIEARLIKIVYKLRLIQAYVIVFFEFILIVCGIGLGPLIVTLISSRSG